VADTDEEEVAVVVAVVVETVMVVTIPWQMKRKLAFDHVPEPVARPCITVDSPS
jgi:hypothetical protein